MNKQRKVLITIAYNDLGCIVDTKAEPYEEPNLQPACNQLATDCISRQAAIDDIKAIYEYHDTVTEDRIIDHLKQLPTAQPEIIRCKDCKWWEKQKDSLQGRCALLQMYPTGAWYCGNARRRGEAE